MLLSEHDTASCDRCGSKMWYGLKSEPTGWKVFYICDPPTGCGVELMIGRVSQIDVESVDEAYQRAESMWAAAGHQLYNDS